MKLRHLEQKDAPFMLEWMHDDNVTEFLGANFAEKNLDDCNAFIDASNDEAQDDLHLAIVNNRDEYMGTVSLKHIDRINSTAEFAISVRSKAMGKGYSGKAMEDIIKLGHGALGLDKIYWCVSEDNKRAIRFYDKNNYHRSKEIPEHILNYYSEKQLEKFIWYVDQM
ncbi:MAG: GNAT family N-acetyltransferase [Lachnospiraceae bacterium]|nr:GNAT family N-acetyltransferase [Lachnospiraceae bacterium]